MSLKRALYRHPAFAPHRLLYAIGLTGFGVQNATITIVFIIVLTLCSWMDHSLIIENGYGYFQHPGVLGWYLIQFVMPVAIYLTLKEAARADKHYREVITDETTFNFKVNFFKPMVAFVGLKTPVSKSLYIFLSIIGFAGFAWNTFQNFLPGKLAPLDFWDSIHFPFGYWASRVHKFYVDALLLPSIIHIFTGIVWANIGTLKFLSKKKQVRLAPFHPDRCGGFGFLADLILSPSVSALLVSSLAFLGVIYTHRAFDVSTVAGIIVQVVILAIFYIIPTLILRSVLIQVKKAAAKDIHQHQQSYYDAILSERLHGEDLRDAHEYLQYFNEMSTAINGIPDWPHLEKVSKIFGISISPSVISSLVSIFNMLKKLYPNLP